MTCSANEPIRSFLIRDMGFSKQGAEDCISAFRTSIKQVGDVSASAPQIVEGPAEQGSGAETDGTERRAAHRTDTRELIRLPLTKDCSVELRFDGAVTTQAIDNLIKHIDLMKTVWAPE